MVTVKRHGVICGLPRNGAHYDVFPPLSKHVFEVNMNYVSFLAMFHCLIHDRIVNLWSSAGRSSIIAVSAHASNVCKIYATESTVHHLSMRSLRSGPAPRLPSMSRHTGEQLLLLCSTFVGIASLLMTQSQKNGV